MANETKKVEIKNPEIIPYEKDEKRGLLDIKAEIDNGIVLDIEMQMDDMDYKKEDEVASKYIEFHYIELPKYKKKEPSKFTKLDQWMCVFTNRKGEIIMAEKENEEIKRAMNTLDFISSDPKERERHNSIVMAEYNRLTSEHNFFEAGKKERNEKRKRRTE